ncbi:hypothetical protein [Sphingosinicella terrae]|uniref:hypothetical protein n=1 Tax=Sphingosinicella terrae TaxID=2172047 RepID=UPI000E0D277C|nr:hypothetical protein [Sphingosinicella terrae]
MSDEPPLPDPATAPTPASEAARVRRRWLTLAEILGVTAVVISGLTLWNNYQQRTAEETERVEAREKSRAASRTLLLRGVPDRTGSRLSLAPADAAQTVQTQTIAFPAALEVALVETVSDARIEAAWFRRPLVRAADDAGRQRGDLRLPVAITTRFFSGGSVHEDVAIYDVGYRIEEGGLLNGDDVRLRGLSRVESVAPAQAQARLDALWHARRPAQD